MRREGIELAGAFTATVNVELRVGALEETITVTGETPIVDVQSSRRQQVLDRRVDQRHPDGADVSQPRHRRARRHVSTSTDVGG